MVLKSTSLYNNVFSLPLWEDTESWEAGAHFVVVRKPWLDIELLFF